MAMEEAIKIINNLISYKVLFASSCFLSARISPPMMVENAEAEKEFFLYFLHKVCHNETDGF